jgi:hypothetical protein
VCLVINSLTSRQKNCLGKTLRERYQRLSARYLSAIKVKKKTCSGRMAGKEKENMKRQGKQRPVGEMAIRWIAKKKSDIDV